MKIKNGTIHFEQCDNEFVKKFGAIEAAEMVTNYKAVCTLPFIYDTHQLAEFLGVGRKTLFYTCRNCNQLYHKITVPKKGGGVRHVYAPGNILKNIQHIIAKEILSHFDVSEYATAYQPGISVFDNAQPHTGKKYIIKMDLCDFFGSIHFTSVYRTVFNTRYFPKQIGTMLTTLCCKDDYLIQGAPTSPAISNIVMKHFDDSMGMWCKKKGITYTRYCDDITFSADRPVFDAYAKAKSFLENIGFEINSRKTRFLTNNVRQCVTGLTVNSKVSVPAEYKRELRLQLHYVLKYGLKDALLHIGEDISEMKYYNSLMGKINYVLSIEPENSYFINAKNQLRPAKPQS